MILGIDPGITGAIAFTRKNQLLIEDMPVIKVGKKYKIDATSFSRLIHRDKYRIKYAIIEDVHAFPGQGVTSTFNFGYGAGILYGVLAAHNIKIIKVKPSVWKPALNLSRDKKKSLELAKRVYPNYKKYFSRLKDDGRAEAALLAHYANLILGDI